jgi:ABC-2 type transport system ATP-binding protein
VIEAQQLTRLFGERAAVEELSFQVGRGEVVGLLGPNGAGKTTTMRLLTTLLEPTRGQARVAGHDVVAAPAAVRRAVGFAPERPPLYDEMTVLDYLELVAALREVPSGERRRRVQEVCARTGLEGVGGRLLGHLSRGYRQRAGLAQALVGRPQVLILDEPTAGLDPNQVQDVRALIRELAGETTVVLSTHLLSEVEATCRRALIIQAGRLAAEVPLASSAGAAGEGLRLRVARDEPGLAGALLAVPGIDAALPDDSALGCYALESTGGDETRERVAELAVERGWGLVELSPVSSSLQEIFARVTGGGEAI